MSGDTVIVRGFRGEPFLARVCSATPEIAYVTGNDNYDRFSKGEIAAAPIGIPRYNVFHYELGLFKKLRQNWQNDLTVWDGLRRWDV